MTAVCYPSCFHGTSFLTERARGSDRAAMDEPVDDFAGADAEAGPEEEPLGRSEKI